MSMSSKKSAGISFELPVLEYLDDLAARERRRRSNLINFIIRKHAASQGTPIEDDMPTIRKTANIEP